MPTMHARLRTRGIGRGVILAAALVGCAGPDPVASVRDLPYGTPIEAGPKPDPAACQDRIRSEIGAAIRIRGELRTPGVGTDEVAARAAAADPTADTAALGIPLTAAELRALERNGLALDNESPIAFWVGVGAPERFGGIWLRGGATNVAVLHGDPATLALARCLEPANAAYVWANVSLAAGTAVLDRIGADMDRWRARGVVINMIDYDETTGVVNVGVNAPTPEMLAAFQEAYGPLIRLVQQGPIVPV